MQIAFANFTLLGQKAQHWVATNAADAVLGVETHCVKEEVGKPAKALLKAGWSTVWAPAAPSHLSNSGSFAGAVAVVKRIRAGLPRKLRVELEWDLDDLSNFAGKDYAFGKGRGADHREESLSMIVEEASGTADHTSVRLCD